MSRSEPQPEPPTRNRAWWLFLLATAALLNYLGWMLATPPLQAPDESQHLLFARDMGHHPQLRWELESTIPEEMLWLGDWVGLGDQDPPRHTSAEALSYWHKFEELAGTPQRRITDRFGRFVPNRPFRRYHPPLYPALCGPAHALLESQPLIRALLVQRLISVLLGVALVVTLYFLGTELWPQHPTHPFGLALLGAFHPTCAFFSSVCNNAILEALLAVLVAWTWVGGCRGGWTLRRSAALGLLFSAGLLVRVSFGTVLLATLTAFCLPVRRPSCPRCWLLILGLPLILAAWWYVPLLSGEAQASLAFYKVDEFNQGYDAPLEPLGSYLGQFEWSRWMWVGLDYWGGVSGSRIWYPTKAADLIGVFWLVAVGLCGSLTLVCLFLKRFQASTPKLVIALILPTLGLLGFYQLADYLLYRGQEGFFLLRDQYLLTGLPGHVLALALGALVLGSWARVRRPLWWLVAACLANNLYCLREILDRNHPGASLPNAVEASARLWWLPSAALQPLPWLMVGATLMILIIYRWAPVQDDPAEVANLNQG